VPASIPAAETPRKRSQEMCKFLWMWEYADGTGIPRAKCPLALESQTMAEHEPSDPVAGICLITYVLAASSPCLLIRSRYIIRLDSTHFRNERTFYEIKLLDSTMADHDFFSHFLGSRPLGV